MAGFAIRCTACGQETFLRREPRYEGFRKVGEDLLCTSCGHVYADEDAVPYVEAPARPAVFSDEDLPQRIELFHSDEKGRNCRHCRHYITNPFVQRCGLHAMEVQATDCCVDFAPPEDAAAEQDPLARLLGA